MCSDGTAQAFSSVSLYFVQTVPLGQAAQMPNRKAAPNPNSEELSISPIFQHLISEFVQQNAGNCFSPHL